jgi:hypothetical protein
MVSGKFLEWFLYGLGALLCGSALRLLAKPGRLRMLAWSAGWSCLMAPGALLLLVGADWGRYRTLIPGAVIATVTFSTPATADIAGYRALIRTPEGSARAIDLSGDHWIFDARTIRCALPACPLQLYRPRHFYAARAQRLDQLPSYDTLVMGGPDGPVDVWSLIARMPRFSSFLTAGEAATARIPVQSGLSYDIRLDGEGRLSVSAQP